MVFNKKSYDKKRNKKLTRFRNKFRGNCVKCGSSENVQFHHIDPATKSNEIVRIKNVRLLRREIKKTECLCKVCHMEQQNISKNLAGLPPPAPHTPR